MAEKLKTKRPKKNVNFTKIDLSVYFKKVKALKLARELSKSRNP